MLYDTNPKVNYETDNLSSIRVRRVTLHKKKEALSYYLPVRSQPLFISLIWLNICLFFFFGFLFNRFLPFSN